MTTETGDKMFANIEEAGNFGSNLAKEIKTYTSTRVVKPLEDRIKQLEVKIAYLEAALDARGGLKYLGIFKEGRIYDEGQFVTFDGSIWHCNARTSNPPGNGSASWVLACKRGQDGRSAK
jgi:hypothetical protein